MNWSDVPGWFDFQGLYEQMVAEAGEGSVFVEVGSWLGRSTAFMAQAIRSSGKPIRFYAVDHGRGSQGLDRSQFSEVVARCGGTVAGELARNLLACGLSSYVIQMVCSSQQASQGFPAASVDFVLIDGEHLHDAVTQDLRAWWPKVKPAGVLAGHDYGCSEVRAAVEEFYGKGAYQWPGHGDCWLIRKSDNLEKVFFSDKTYIPGVRNR